MVIKDILPQPISFKTITKACCLTKVLIFVQRKSELEITKNKFGYKTSGSSSREYVCCRFQPMKPRNCINIDEKSLTNIKIIKSVKSIKIINIWSSAAEAAAFE